MTKQKYSEARKSRPIHFSFVSLNIPTVIYQKAFVLYGLLKVHHIQLNIPHESTIYLSIPNNDSFITWKELLVNKRNF